MAKKRLKLKGIHQQHQQHQQQQQQQQQHGRSMKNVYELLKALRQSTAAPALLHMPIHELLSLAKTEVTCPEFYDRFIVGAVQQARERGIVCSGNRSSLIQGNGATTEGTCQHIFLCPVCTEEMLTAQQFHEHHLQHIDASIDIRRAVERVWPGLSGGNNGVISNRRRSSSIGSGESGAVVYATGSGGERCGNEESDPHDEFHDAIEVPDDLLSGDDIMGVVGASNDDVTIENQIHSGHNAAIHVRLDPTDARYRFDRLGKGLEDYLNLVTWQIETFRRKYSGVLVGGRIKLAREELHKFVCCVGDHFPRRTLRDLSAFVAVAGGVDNILSRDGLARLNPDQITRAWSATYVFITRHLWPSTPSGDLSIVPMYILAVKVKEYLLSDLGQLVTEVQRLLGHYDIMLEDFFEIEMHIPRGSKPDTFTKILANQPDAIWFLHNVLEHAKVNSADLLSFFSMVERLSKIHHHFTDIIENGITETLRRDERATSCAAFLLNRQILQTYIAHMERLSFCDKLETEQKEDDFRRLCDRLLHTAGSKFVETVVLDFLHLKSGRQYAKPSHPWQAGDDVLMCVRHLSSWDLAELETRFAIGHPIHPRSSEVDATLLGEHMNNFPRVCAVVSAFSSSMLALPSIEDVSTTEGLQSLESLGIGEGGVAGKKKKVKKSGQSVAENISCSDNAIECFTLEVPDSYLRHWYSQDPALKTLPNHLISHDIQNIFHLWLCDSGADEVVGLGDAGHDAYLRRQEEALELSADLERRAKLHNELKEKLSEVSKFDRLVREIDAYSSQDPFGRLDFFAGAGLASPYDLPLAISDIQRLEHQLELRAEAFEYNLHYEDRKLADAECALRKREAQLLELQTNMAKITQHTALPHSGSGNNSGALGNKKRGNNNDAEAAVAAVAKENEEILLREIAKLKEAQEEDRVDIMKNTRWETFLMLKKTRELLIAVRAELSNGSNQISRELVNQYRAASLTDYIGVDKFRTRVRELAFTYRARLRLLELTFPQILRQLLDVVYIDKMATVTALWKRTIQEKLETEADRLHHQKCQAAEESLLAELLEEEEAKKVEAEKKARKQAKKKEAKARLRAKEKEEEREREELERLRTEKEKEEARHAEEELQAERQRIDNERQAKIDVLQLEAQEQEDAKMAKLLQASEEKEPLAREKKEDKDRRRREKRETKEAVSAILPDATPKDVTGITLAHQQSYPQLQQQLPKKKMAPVVPHQRPLHPMLRKLRNAEVQRLLMTVLESGTLFPGDLTDAAMEQLDSLPIDVVDACLQIYAKIRLSPGRQGLSGAMPRMKSRPRDFFTFIQKKGDEWRRLQHQPQLRVYPGGVKQENDVGRVDLQYGKGDAPLPGHVGPAATRHAELQAKPTHTMGIHARALLERQKTAAAQAAAKEALQLQQQQQLNKVQKPPASKLPPPPPPINAWTKGTTASAVLSSGCATSSPDGMEETDDNDAEVDDGNFSENIADDRRVEHAESEETHENCGDRKVDSYTNDNIDAVEDANDHNDVLISQPILGPVPQKPISRPNESISSISPSLAPGAPVIGVMPGLFGVAGLAGPHSSLNSKTPPPDDVSRRLQQSSDYLPAQFVSTVGSHFNNNGALSQWQQQQQFESVDTVSQQQFVCMQQQRQEWGMQNVAVNAWRNQQTAQPSQALTSNGSYGGANSTKRSPPGICGNVWGTPAVSAPGANRPVKSAPGLSSLWGAPSSSAVSGASGAGISMLFGGDGDNGVGNNNHKKSTSAPFGSSPPSIVGLLPTHSPSLSSNNGRAGSDGFNNAHVGMQLASSGSDYLNVIGFNNLQHHQQKQQQQLNDFSAMISLSLWHVETFSMQFIEGRSPCLHAMSQPSCLCCALRDLHSAISAGAHDDSTEYFDHIRLIISNEAGLSPDDMASPSHVLDAMLSLLHHVTSINRHNTPRAFASPSVWLCDSDTCLPHSVFGIHLRDESPCLACSATPMPVNYVKFVHHVSTSGLRLLKTKQPLLEFSQCLHLLAASEKRECEACQMRNSVHRTLLQAPPALALVLLWDNRDTSPDELVSLLTSIELRVDLVHIFTGLGHGETHILTGMTVAYGTRFIQFAFNKALGSWFAYYGITLKEVGSWQSVLERCSRNTLRPTTLFYEIQQPQRLF